MDAPRLRLGEQKRFAVEQAFADEHLVDVRTGAVFHLTRVGESLGSDEAGSQKKVCKSVAIGGPNLSDASPRSHAARLARLPLARSPHNW